MQGAAVDSLQFGRKAGYGGGGGYGCASSYNRPSGGYGGGGYGGNRNFGGRGGGASQEISTAPFRKNFYVQAPEVKDMSADEVRKVRDEGEIKLTAVPASVSDRALLNPLTKFEYAGFGGEMVKRLYGAGFKVPSPIQSQAWPILLSGHDMIGIAVTGSGKTLAFLLPGVVHAKDQPALKHGEGPIALILAPTRELVTQIRQECQKFCGNVRSGVAYGGAPRRTQLYDLQRGVEVLVACPGRLLDFVEKGDVGLGRVTYLVLDEADRMLDMGFEPQIRSVVEKIRPDRQTLMFSATWPKEVQGLARDLCPSDPVHVTIGSTDLKANMSVTQKVEVMQDNNGKRRRLAELMKQLYEQDPEQRIIIFTETKMGCDRLADELRSSGFRAAEIHGDKEQRQREYTLKMFKNGQTPILIATDVASRGLDVQNVKVVINYDMPHQVEDYVHRIGRTGRAGATGVAYSFMTADKAGKFARELVRVMQDAGQEVSAELLALARMSGGSSNSRWGGNRGFRGGNGGFGGFGGGNRRGGGSGGPYGGNRRY